MTDSEPELSRVTIIRHRAAPVKGGKRTCSHPDCTEKRARSSSYCRGHWNERKCAYYAKAKATRDAGDRVSAVQVREVRLAREAATADETLDVAGLPEVSPGRNGAVDRTEGESG